MSEWNKKKWINVQLSEWKNGQERLLGEENNMEKDTFDCQAFRLSAGNYSPGQLCHVQFSRHLNQKINHQTFKTVLKCNKLA